MDGAPDPPPETADELYEYAPVGYLTTRPDGTITRANATLLGWLGRRQDELIGSRLESVLTPAARSFLETHCTPTLIASGSLREIALDLVAADGTHTPALLSWRPIIDGEAQLVGYRVLVVEASERRSYERQLLAERDRAREAIEALRINEARFRRIAEAGMIGVGFGDASGRIGYVNDAFLAMIGHTRADFNEGRINWRALTAPEWAAADEGGLAELAERGVCGPFEKEYLLADGSRLPVQIDMALNAPGDPYGEHIVLVADMRRQKAAEATLQRRTQRSELLADLGKRLLEQNEFDDGVLAWLYGELRDICGVDVGFAYADSGECLQQVFCFGIAPETAAGIATLAFGEGLCGTVAQKRAGLYLTEVQVNADAQTEVIRTLGVRAFVCEPLQAGGALLGTLSFASRTRDGFSAGERGLFAAIADQIAIARQRTEAFAALKGSETRLRVAIGAARAGSWELNLRTDGAVLSPECVAMLGLPPEHDGRLTLAQSRSLVHPEDRAKVDAAFQQVLATGEPYDLVYRVRRDDGTRWIHGRGSVTYGSDGAPDLMLGMNIDVTEQHEVREREQLLMREVDHRAKNLLAVVQSVVQLTRAEDVPTFTKAVAGRIQALARAHSLLAESRWEGGDLKQIIADELAPYAGAGGAPRVRMQGPSLRLKPAAAQAAALVVHELATNAAKYGALSVSAGKLDILWAISLGEDQTLSLRWQERGGPPVAPPSRRGFGSTIITASIERQLRGTVSLDWAQEGLTAELTFPAEQIVDVQGAARAAEAGSGKARRAPGKETRHSGLRVMVLEDDAVIGMQIEAGLTAAGCAVIGPVARIGDAFELIFRGEVEAALLDVDVAGERSFPVGDVLRSKGIPFAFVTGFAQTTMPPRLADVLVLAKPFREGDLGVLLQRFAQERSERNRDGGGAFVVPALSPMSMEADAAATRRGDSPGGER